MICPHCHNEVDSDDAVVEMADMVEKMRIVMAEFWERIKIIEAKINQ